MESHQKVQKQTLLFMFVILKETTFPWTALLEICMN